MKKRKWVKWLLLAAAALLVALSISAYRGATRLTVTSYQVTADTRQALRIVHLTDLHSVSYGEDNAELVERIASQKPDLIFLTGDMLSGSDEGPDVVCELIPKLVEIAPVYYGYGNHEKDWEARTGEKLEPRLTAAGAVVLDCAYVDVEVNGQPLRIGGYYGYYRRSHMTTDDDTQMQREQVFFDAFENTGNPKLLLCHIPTAWVDWNLIDKFPAGVVFSGHYHGGQVRLPLIGGLYAPYVGAFPEYTKGVFAGTQATCVLSAGLGSEKNIPRINNLPEIVVVDLIPE